MTMTKTSFPLRLQEDERTRARRLANELGVSENRLYADLIHDGLLMREQMLYMTKLRDLAGKTAVEDALAVLDKAPDAPVLPTDVY
jgi:isopentenyldiphosphate isomerase